MNTASAEPDQSGCFGDCAGAQQRTAMTATVMDIEAIRPSVHKRLTAQKRIPY